MKYVYFYVFLLFTLCACSSDDIPEFPLELPDEPMKEYTVELPLMADSVLEGKEAGKSRGWTDLSMKTVYLVVNYTSSNPADQKYLPLTVNPESNSLFENYEFKGSIRFTLSIDEKGKNIYVSNGSSTFAVKKNGKPYNCMLTTANSINVELAAHAGDYVNGTTQVYEPCGDNVFRSHGFIFSGKWEKKRVGNIVTGFDYISYPLFNLIFKTGGVDKAFSTFDTGYKSNTVKFPNDLAFQMDRYTCRVRADYLMVLFNEKRGVPSGLPHLTFVDSTQTKVHCWAVKTYLKNSPNKFHLKNDIGQPKAGTSFIALSQGAEGMSEDYVTQKELKSWNINWDLAGLLSVKGIGKRYGTNEGYAHVFPTVTAESCICYKFIYNDEQTKETMKMSLLVPINNANLSANCDYYLTAIFSVKDFKKQIENYRKTVKSRAGNENQEEYIMDIPYKLIQREIKH